MYEHVKTGCKHIPLSKKPLQFQSGYYLNKPRLQYTVLVIQYTVQGIQHTVYSIGYTAYSTGYSIQHRVYRIQYTAQGIQYTVYSTGYTEHIYTVYRNNCCLFSDPHKTQAVWAERGIAKC